MVLGGLLALWQCQGLSLLYACGQNSEKGFWFYTARGQRLASHRDIHFQIFLLSLN